MITAASPKAGVGTGVLVDSVSVVTLLVAVDDSVATTNRLTPITAVIVVDIISIVAGFDDFLQPIPALRDLVLTG